VLRRVAVETAAVAFYVQPAPFAEQREVQPVLNPAAVQYYVLAAERQPGGFKGGAHKVLHGHGVKDGKQVRRALKAA
jgi:hypothetical protein